MSSKDGGRTLRSAKSQTVASSSSEPAPRSPMRRSARKRNHDEAKRQGTPPKSAPSSHSDDDDRVGSAEESETDAGPVRKRLRSADKGPASPSSMRTSNKQNLNEKGRSQRRARQPQQRKQLGATAAPDGDGVGISGSGSTEDVVGLLNGLHNAMAREHSSDSDSRNEDDEVDVAFELAHAGVLQVAAEEEEPDAEVGVETSARSRGAAGEDLEIPDSVETNDSIVAPEPDVQESHMQEQNGQEPNGQGPSLTPDEQLLDEQTAAVAGRASPSRRGRLTRQRAAEPSETREVENGTATRRQPRRGSQETHDENVRRTSSASGRQGPGDVTENAALDEAEESAGDEDGGDSDLEYVSQEAARGPHAPFAAGLEADVPDEDHTTRTLDIQDPGAAVYTVKLKCDIVNKILKMLGRIAYLGKRTSYPAAEAEFWTDAGFCGTRPAKKAMVALRMLDVFSERVLDSEDDAAARQLLWNSADRLKAAFLKIETSVSRCEAILQRAAHARGRVNRDAPEWAMHMQVRDRVLDDVRKFMMPGLGLVLRSVWRLGKGDIHEAQSYLVGTGNFTISVISMVDKIRSWLSRLLVAQNGIDKSRDRERMSEAQLQKAMRQRAALGEPLFQLKLMMEWAQQMFTLAPVQEDIDRARRDREMRRVRQQEDEQRQRQLLSQRQWELMCESTRNLPNPIQAGRERLAALSQSLDGRLSQSPPRAAVPSRPPSAALPSSLARPRIGRRVKSVTIADPPVAQVFVSQTLYGRSGPAGDSEEDDSEGPESSDRDNEEMDDFWHEEDDDSESFPSPETLFYRSSSRLPSSSSLGSRPEGSAQGASRTSPPPHMPWSTRSSPLSRPRQGILKPPSRLPRPVGAIQRSLPPPPSQSSSSPQVASSSFPSSPMVGSRSSGPREVATSPTNAARITSSSSSSRRAWSREEHDVLLRFLSWSARAAHGHDVDGSAHATSTPGDNTGIADDQLLQMHRRTPDLGGLARQLDRSLADVEAEAGRMCATARALAAETGAPTPAWAMIVARA